MTLFQLSVNQCLEAATNQIAALSLLRFEANQTCVLHQPDEVNLDTFLTHSTLSGCCYCLLTLACDLLVQACFV